MQSPLIVGKIRGIVNILTPNSKCKLIVQQSIFRQLINRRSRVEKLNRFVHSLQNGGGKKRSIITGGHSISKTSTAARLSLILSVTMILSACGGGGSSNRATGPAAAADTTAPTVTITSPATSVAEGGMLTLTATSTENLTPSITCDMGTVNGTVFTAPTVVADAMVICTANATDTAGNSGMATVTITVTNNASGGGSGASSAALGIIPVPAGEPAEFRNNYERFTSVTAPNGGQIKIYAQSEITDEQMVRARSILEFFLENVPLSTYGSNKLLIANQMATNDARLIMLNGSDDGNPPTGGQTLYATENVVEGTAAYMANDPRDAAFEEILHLVHDNGIGVDGPNTMPGVSSVAAFQTQLRAATENAITAGVNGVSSGAAQLGLWGGNDLANLNELSMENSLTQEYLASMVDVYYGFAGEIGPNEDQYTPTTRAEMETMDPMGWALVGEDTPRAFFNPFVTYVARIDAGFSGTFTMTFDANERYTYKSQYLLNARLTGINDSNLTGNEQHNRLSGNAGTNIIDGAGGEDIAVFQGPFSEYTVTISGNNVQVVDSQPGRDGATTLVNVESMEFSDQIAFVDGNMIGTDSDPFLGLMQMPISAQELVDNTSSGGDISLQLNFRGSINLPDGTTREWDASERAPYVTGANRWLEVLSRAGNVPNYMLEINIGVTTLANANGVASPEILNMYVDGNNVFPSQGTFVVNACLYLEVTAPGCTNPLMGSARTAEFDANVRHEIGHIMGIGSLWNLDSTASPNDFSNQSFGQGSFRNWVSESTPHGGPIYRQPQGVAAYNSFTSSSFDFAPVVTGHLYSENDNMPSGSTRSFNGTVLPSLETELMASNNNYTPVLFGFLEDLGWVIGSNPRPNQP